jgi:hypothetical protein
LGERALSVPYQRFEVTRIHILDDAAAGAVQNGGRNTPAGFNECTNLLFDDIRTLTPEHDIQSSDRQARDQECVEFNVKVMIATIFQRTWCQARRKARRARGQRRGCATMAPRLAASSPLGALAVSPVSFGNVQSPDAGIGLSEGSRVAVLRSLR